MPVSHRDGYTEGAMFLFYDDGSVLVEHRPADDGTVTFVPNGKVEEADGAADAYDDHALAALHREVSEEFAGRVDVESASKLCEYTVEDPALWFHCYVVTDWSGEVPDYTVEGGERFADLEWIPLDEYDDHLELPSALAACRRLDERREEFE